MANRNERVVESQLGFVDDRTYPSFPWFRFESAVAACTRNELSQYETVLYVLQAARGFWVCGSFFYRVYLSAARNRVGEIRADFGEDIVDSERCTDPEHRHRPRSSIYRYRYTR